MKKNSCNLQRKTLAPEGSNVYAQPSVKTWFTCVVRKHANRSIMASKTNSCTHKERRFETCLTEKNGGWVASLKKRTQNSFNPPSHIYCRHRTPKKLTCPKVLKLRSKRRSLVHFWTTLFSVGGTTLLTLVRTCREWICWDRNGPNKYGQSQGESSYPKRGLRYRGELSHPTRGLPMLGPGEIIFINIANNNCCTPKIESIKDSFKIFRIIEGKIYQELMRP